MKRDCVHVCASLLTRIALAAAVAPALAGPPFRTDDPVPVPHRQGGSLSVHRTHGIIAAWIAAIALLTAAVPARAGADVSD